MKIPYQDVWRDGALVTKGRRECAERFDLIRDHLGPVDSLLDVGGWDGYFARRFAETGAQATLIEPRNVPDLPPGVTHRQQRVDASTDLGTHDAALALSVLHHMDDWADVYANLRRAARHVVIELAMPDELDGELSPTLVETGPRIGPSSERILEDGKTLGTARGPNGNRRPLVAVESVWSGTVDSGTGRASEAMDAYSDNDWLDLLGYVPSPGTLNVRVGAAGKKWARHLLDPVELPDPGGTRGPYWPATAGGVNCHVRTSRSRTGVEVVAHVNLRSHLGLSDGDSIELALR